MSRVFLSRHWPNPARFQHTGPRRADRPIRQQTRLVLEALEGRWVPTTVTNLNDSGAGSLRQAIIDTPAGGTVDFQPGLTGTITLTTGELAIGKDVTIAGPGAGVITVSGNHALRVFHIATASTVAISGLTIADGQVSGSTVMGGGIDNQGMLTLADCTVSNNSASANQIVSAAFGGGIANAGTLIVTDCTVTGNSIIGGDIVRGGVWGGGIYNGGTLTVTESTLNGNSASAAGFAGAAYGAGIANAGTLTLAGSTLSGNAASGTGVAGSGGGISNSSTLTVIDSTLSDNQANGNGGGIYGGSTQVTVRNTIVATNTGLSAPDLSGTLDSQGHNLIGDGTGGSGYADTDLVGTAENPIDPLLGPLQDNGGPSQTIALLPGSPALNAGDPAQLGVADQRGVIRAGGVNIGAYQASAASFILTAPPKVTAGTPFNLTVTAVDSFGQRAVGYTGTVTFSTTDPDPRVVLPADYSFTLGDGGTHTFTDTGLAETTLWTRGYQTITATDTGDGSILGSATVKVRHASNASLLPGFGGGLRSQWTDYLYVPEQPGQDAE
jgi:hypothetical protein